MNIGWLPSVSGRLGNRLGNPKLCSEIKGKYFKKSSMQFRPREADAGYIWGLYVGMMF